MTNELYTIGHSIHSVEDFIGLLQMHSITAVCDVRSHPYSQFNPQFNRDNIKKYLNSNGIAYVFLGEELGARSENPACYTGGKAQYHYLAAVPSFALGVNRLLQGMKRYSIALMCAEKDPITCHRMILICRKMRPIVTKIQHILESGQVETNAAAEARLLDTLKIVPDMFRSRPECIEEAYNKQGQRIAFAKEEKQIAIG